MVPVLVLGCLVLFLSVSFVVICLFVVIVPAVCEWVGPHGSGLQDRLVRTMAAISSSMSTSCGLIWLQEDTHGSLEDSQKRALTWGEVVTSDLLGTLMLEDTDLRQDEGWSTVAAATVMLMSPVS